MSLEPPLSQAAVGTQTALARGGRGRPEPVVERDVEEYGTGLRARLVRGGVMLVWRPALPSFEGAAPRPRNRYS